jgi:MSHA biogenesis protein MshP
MIALKRANGFSIVAALFVVVVLALIGSYMVSLGALTQSSQSLSMQGVRAYYAARSGLEWGAYMVAPSTASGGSEPYNCPTSPTTLSFTQGGLNGFTSTVTCSQSSFTEAGITYNTFQIRATGQYKTVGDMEYVFRELYTNIIQPGI